MRRSPSASVPTACCTGSAEGGQAVVFVEDLRRGWRVAAETEVEALIERAYAGLRTGDPVAAHAAFDAVYAREPARVEGLAGIVMLPVVDEDIDRALALEPDNALAHTELCKLLEGLGATRELAVEVERYAAVGRPAEPVRSEDPGPSGGLQPRLRLRRSPG